MEEEVKEEKNIGLQEVYIVKAGNWTMAFEDIDQALEVFRFLKEKNLRWINSEYYSGDQIGYDERGSWFVKSELSITQEFKLLFDKKEDALRHDAAIIKLKKVGIVKRKS